MQGSSINHIQSRNNMQLSATIDNRGAGARPHTSGHGPATDGHGEGVARAARVRPRRLTGCEQWSLGRGHGVATTRLVLAAVHTGDLGMAATAVDRGRAST